MTEPITTAASPPSDPGAGQAASAQQGAPQQGSTPVQGGQDPATGQGQQGTPSGSAPQPAAVTPPAAAAAAGTTPTPPVAFQLSLPEQSPLEQADIDAT